MTTEQIPKSDRDILADRIDAAQGVALRSAAYAFIAIVYDAYEMGRLQGHKEATEGNK